MVSRLAGGNLFLQEPFVAEEARPGLAPKTAPLGLCGQRGGRLAKDGFQCSQVFVLLTIVFGVSTFIFFSQYREARDRATAATQKASEDSNRARDALAQMEQLKKMVGFAATDTVESIQGLFNGDMDKYAKTYPKDMQFYRPALTRMAEALKEKDESLTNEQASVAKLKADLVALDNFTKVEIAKHDQNAKDAQKDKEDETNKFGVDRKKLEDELAKMNGTLTQNRKASDAAQADLTNKLVVATDGLKERGDHLVKTKKKLEDIQSTTPPEKFQGEVRWVNQHQGIVWIDLGRADALQPRTTFSVYAAGPGEMTEIGKKASIEVTEVLGNHLAQARILDDRAANPIVPGDKIFTPVWSLGEKRHFAIVGLIDLNGDGRYDPEELRRLHTLIEMNGGVVDAPLDAEGKRRGKMTLDTRYLIEGQKPDASSSPGQLEDFSLMTDDAAKLRVESIALEKFLNRMGWSRESQVLLFGGEGNIPISTEKTPPISRGRINDLFKPRQPPRSSGGSTF